MNPISHIDIFRLVSCHVVSHTDAVARIAPAQQSDISIDAMEPRRERRVQIRALFTGTLLFLPVLAAYLVACSSH